MSEINKITTFAPPESGNPWDSNRNTPWKDPLNWALWIGGGALIACIALDGFDIVDINGDGE